MVWRGNQDLFVTYIYTEFVRHKLETRVSHGLNYIFFDILAFLKCNGTLIFLQLIQLPFQFTLHLILWFPISVIG